MREIHFVTGKGGVGKSLTAAALALKKSQEGLKVLLVELGDQSFYKDFYGLKSVDFAPTTLTPNLDIALWSGDACLREYAHYLIKVQTLSNLFFDNPVMRAFINIAPALPELAIMGKITSAPRKHGPPLNYDCLVVDAFATGHFIALMEAPKGMSEAVKLGPMGEQSRGIDRWLRDPEFSKYHIVTLPEELPAKEATELMDQLRSEFEVQPELIVNKVIGSRVQNEELQQAKQEGGDLGSFAAYLLTQMHTQGDVVHQLEQKYPGLRKVPLFFEMDPWRLTELMAEALP